MDPFVYIPEDRVKELLNWESVYAAVESAMRAVSDARTNQPARSFTSVLNTEKVLLTMPGYLEDGKFGALGCKLVTAFPENARKNVAAILANILLFDVETGALKAVISGTEITTWRTAAASVVASKYIFPRILNQQLVLGILGAGTQGEIHAHAFHHFFNFKKIKIWNRTHSKAVKLVSELNKKYGDVNLFAASETEEGCVRDSDVVITATFTTTPIVKQEWLKEDAHINAVGAGFEGLSELEESIYYQSDVYTDHLVGAKTELAHLMEKEITFKGEVGSAINKSVQPSPTKRKTIFHSLGMAVEDCAMARLIYDLHMTDTNKS